MAEEKIFTMNLRREILKKPHHQRAKRAVKATGDYIKKHMKVSEVKIGKNLNDLLWSRGNRNPPTRIKVKSIIEEGYARVELPEFEFEKKKEEKKETLKEKLLGKKEEKPETAKEKIIDEREKEIKEEEELVKEGGVKPVEKQKKQGYSREEDVMIKKRKTMARDEKPSHEAKLTKNK